KGRQVARDSQHTHGNAVDFFLPTVPIHSLHAWAKQQRLGGVGIYLGSGFIHMDTGAIRYWSGE
ncbi:MAG: YcbK family protein, partial [Kofleriaceae bacterium]